MHSTIQRYITDAGNLTQSVGLGRVPGQLFAYLYFSYRPRNLAEMQEALGISKGSASQVVRQLEQWGAVRKVWIKGDRRDYYEANEWLGQIVRNIMRDVIGKRLATANSLLDMDEKALPAGDKETEFIRDRIENIRRFQRKATQAFNNPLISKLLKK